MFCAKLVGFFFFLIDGYLPRGRILYILKVRMTKCKLKMSGPIKYGNLHF